MFEPSGQELIDIVNSTILNENEKIKSKYSVIIAATNYWKDQSPVLHEPNLEKLLKVSHFKQPYVTENTE